MSQARRAAKQGRSCGLDLGVFGGQLVLGARRVVGILLGLYVRPDRIFHDEACSWCPLRG